jgi:hypothetical protein
MQRINSWISRRSRTISEVEQEQTHPRRMLWTISLGMLPSSAPGVSTVRGTEQPLPSGLVYPRWWMAVLTTPPPSERGPCVGGKTYAPSERGAQSQHNRCR